MHLSAAQTRVKLFPPSTCTASVVTFMGDRSRSASRPTPVGCAGVRHPVGGPRRDRCPCRIRGRGHVGQKEPEPVVVEDPLAEGRPLLCLVDGDIERRRGEARCHGRDSWATAVEGTEGNRQSLPPPRLRRGDRAREGRRYSRHRSRAGVQPHLLLRPAELDAVGRPGGEKARYAAPPRARADEEGVEVCATAVSDPGLGPGVAVAVVVSLSPAGEGGDASTSIIWRYTS